MPASRPPPTTTPSQSTALPPTDARYPAIARLSSGKPGTGVYRVEPDRIPLDAPLGDPLRRAEVRLTGAQINDVAALRPEAFGERTDGHRGGWL